MPNDHSPPPRSGAWREEVAFLRRVLIVGAVIALALFLWTVRGALLLAFGAVLVAVLLRAAADLAQRRLRVPRRWSVAVACLAIFVPLLLVLALVGNEMREQAALLLRNLPQAAETLDQRFGIRIPVPGSPGSDATQPSADATTVGAVAQHAASAAMVALDALGALVVALVGGIFIAGDPERYRKGLGRLVPRSQAARVDDAMEASGKALTLWIKAQLIAMALVGLATGLGAWAIGLPAPLALGLFAALADVVPLVGPFIGAVPGLLLAFNMGWEMVLWAAALYLVVQQVEGNLLQPVLGERMVSIPPALLLFSVVAAGAVLGLGGVLLAAPLTVVAVVMIGKLYVRETLGRSVEVPGEGEPD
jgi:predicted PurR-regulated permease PerM